MPRSTGNGQDKALAPFGVPPWIDKMRRAAMDAITDADIKAIVQKQVEKAKEGDPNALKFVFDQVLGGAQLKGATFVQTNHHYGEDAQPDKPTHALPGTKPKIAAMAARAASGRPIFDENDDERDLE